MDIFTQKSMLSFLLCGLFFIYSFPVMAEHNLKEFERKCEVEWDGNEGEIDCRLSVSDRRAIERKCEAERDGDDGEFDCSGRHFRDIERRCTVDADGDIDC